MLNNLVGIGLRYPHLSSFNSTRPDIGWVEIHSENFYSLGGPDFHYLLKARANYPVSIHGIGMSLGSAEGLDDKHLKLVKNLIREIDPFLVSDHLSWNTIGNKFLPDLLPTPFNKDTLKVFANNISYVQEKLGRKILLENPSTYFEYTNSTYSEIEFLNELIKITGAGILLDVNNVYISSLNNGWSAYDYISKINKNCIEEIHLSGHSKKQISKNAILYIDSHDRKVSKEVWELFKFTIDRFGKLPTLIEWDVNIPSFEILLEEAFKINKYLTNTKNTTEAICLA